MVFAGDHLFLAQSVLPIAVDDLAVHGNIEGTGVRSEGDTAAALNGKILRDLDVNKIGGVLFETDGMGNGLVGDTEIACVIPVL